MPNTLRIGGFAFSFYAADLREPPHVHVRKAGCEAKFWIDPDVRLADNRGFRPHELRRIERLANENRDHLMNGWNEFLDR